MGGGIGFGVIYLDASRVGFDRPILLPDSHVCDAVLATHTAALLHDGARGNLLLGTYGHELMLYGPAPSSAALLTSAFPLTARLSFEAPIYSLLSVKLCVTITCVCVCLIPS